MLEAYAGTYIGGDLVETTHDAIDRMLNLNVNVVMKNVHDVLPHMIERRSGDIIVTFDIDGSADPHEIPRFVEALVRGADLAKGSRFCAGGGSQDITPFRSVGNAGLNLVASAMTGTRFSDLCYGFNAFWADQIPLLDLPGTKPADGPQVGDGFEIEAMIIGRFAISKAIIRTRPSGPMPHSTGRSRSKCSAVVSPTSSNCVGSMRSGGSWRRWTIRTS